MHLHASPLSVYCPQRSPSSSSNLATLMKDSPMSPSTLPTSSSRLTRCSALRVVSVSFTSNSMTCVFSALREASSSEVGRLLLMALESGDIEVLNSLNMRMKSLLFRAGCEASAGVTVLRSCAISCFGSLATPSRTDACDGFSADHSGDSDSSPSHSRNTRSSELWEMTGWPASLARYFSSASRLPSMKSLVMRCPSTTFFSGRGGTKNPRCVCERSSDSSTKSRNRLRTRHSRALNEGRLVLVSTLYVM
mmetsp:Transcript_29762/g.70970  ORF Transcript_29762/g.70970 Transcript_29762/m.70970 type:complete len:250 (-) Transcript_29762:568-1317(-)